MKKAKLFISIVILIIFSLFILGYFSNSLSSWGLCKPGYKVGGGIWHSFCYIPSGFDGQYCDKKTDCGTASCLLVDPNKTTNKGICRDLEFGCHTWIDENGLFDENNMLCTE